MNAKRKRPIDKEHSTPSKTQAIRSNGAKTEAETATMVSRRNYEHLSEDDKSDIEVKLMTIELPRMQITNWIFFAHQLEICYLLEGDHSYDKSHLSRKLSVHLDLDSSSLILTKLKVPPIYEETTLRPGDAIVRVEAALGAMVKIEGKGIHALMSGHGRQQGDIIQSSSGNRVGTVNVALHGTGGNWALHRDVALARLENQSDYLAHVISHDVHLGLKEEPVDANNEMRIKRFTADGRVGVVESTRYAKLDPETNVVHRYILAAGNDGRPIHSKGESGTIIVEHDPSQERAKAVGMLTEVVTMEGIEADRRKSLGVHLKTNFQALEGDAYCNGSQVKFAQL